MLLNLNSNFYKKGEKLILFAQINLEKESFESSKLPNIGILQFFVENNFKCMSAEANKEITRLPTFLPRRSAWCLFK